MNSIDLLFHSKDLFILKPKLYHQNYFYYCYCFLIELNFYCLVCQCLLLLMFHKFIGLIIISLFHFSISINILVIFIFLMDLTGSLRLLHYLNYYNSNFGKYVYFDCIIISLDSLDQLLCFKCRLLYFTAYFLLGYFNIYLYM
jgi:hypothetical protein